MTIIFHRLNDYPDGYGFGYPSGSFYDYINDPEKNGVVGAVPALADGIIVGGPNEGSYFVGYKEDGLSSAVNRALTALAQNTDTLDNILRRPLATPKETAIAVASGAVASVELPDAEHVYLGLPSLPLEDNLSRLFKVVDDQDNEIIDPVSGAVVTVTSISGGVVGTGFSTGPITVNVVPSIPDGTAYRVRYAVRTNQAMLPENAWLLAAIGGVRTDGKTQDLFRRLRSPASVNEEWDAIPFTTTIYDLAWGGLNERYKRATERDATAPDAHPVAPALDTPGAGGWFVKDQWAPGVVGYATITGAHDSLEDGEYLLGAVWGARIDNQLEHHLGDGTREMAGSGFVCLAERPGSTLFGFFDGSLYGERGFHALEEVTLLPVGTEVTITRTDGATVLTLPPSAHFCKDGRGVFALGRDILVVELAGKRYPLLCDSYPDHDAAFARTATVRHVDGTTFKADGVGTIVEWIRPSMTSQSREFFRTGTSYFFHETSDDIFDPVLSWGGFDFEQSAYVIRGSLFADGTAELQALRGINGQLTVPDSTKVVLKGELEARDGGFLSVDAGSTLDVQGTASFMGTTTFWSSSTVFLSGTTTCGSASEVKFLGNTTFDGGTHTLKKPLVAEGSGKVTKRHAKVTANNATLLLSLVDVVSIALTSGPATVNLKDSNFVGIGETVTVIQPRILGDLPSTLTVNIVKDAEGGGTTTLLTKDITMGTFHGYHVAVFMKIDADRWMAVVGPVSEF